MKNLFGKEVKPKDTNVPQILTIEITDEFKNELREIFRNRVKYYSERIEELLSEEDLDNIEKNVEDIFNFNLTKSSLTKQVDFFNENKLTLVLIQNKDKEFCIKNFSNYKEFKRNPKQLIAPILETIKNNYGVAVKYCSLGYINNKRKMKYYE